jgi:hypothetical protein
MADLNAVFLHNDSLVTRDLAGEKIIVPVRRNVGDLSSIYTLNPVANEIWLMLDGQQTVQQIIQSLEQEYDVDAVRLAADVCRVLDELSGEGLILTKSN